MIQMNGNKECGCCVGDVSSYCKWPFPSVVRSLVFNVRGNILGLPRERLELLLPEPTTGDDIPPLFEPSRANERLLIDSPCFYSFRLAEEYINNLCHGMPE